MLLSLPLVSFFPTSRRSAIPILVESTEFFDTHGSGRSIYAKLKCSGGG